MRLILLAALATGCTSVSRTVDRSVSAAQADLLSVSIERGDLTYVGTDTDTFDVEITTTGRGSSTTRACAARETADWALALRPGTFTMTATAGDRAEVDFDVVGPDVMDTEVTVERGGAHLENVEGTHVVTASRITSRQLIGDVDLVAESGGMNVEIWPYVDGTVLLDSRSGDVSLYLPYGGDYDVEVVGDPAYELFVTDLGFHTSFLDVGYFRGTVGDGSILVSVTVTGGAFELLESF